MTLKLQTGTEPVFKKTLHLAGAILLAVLLYSSIQNIIPTKTANFSNTYTEYVVEGGDTLWSIAKAHRGRRDVRDVVWELQEVNGITPVIQVGDVIWVPEVE